MSVLDHFKIFPFPKSKWHSIIFFNLKKLNSSIRLSFAFSQISFSFLSKTNNFFLVDWIFFLKKSFFVLNRSNRKKQFVLFPSYLLFFCSNEQKRLFRGSTDLLVEFRSVNLTGKKWIKFGLEEHGLMTTLHDLIGLVAPDQTLKTIGP